MISTIFCSQVFSYRFSDKRCFLTNFLKLWSQVFPQGFSQSYFSHRFFHSVLNFEILSKFRLCKIHRFFHRVFPCHRVFHIFFTAFSQVFIQWWNEISFRMFKDIKAKIELVNPKNICSCLWGFKNTELKWGFVKAAVSKAVHLQECLLHFVRELLLYSWTLIIWTLIIWTCFPGPVFFHEH